MSYKHYYMATDFAQACEQLENSGFAVDEAKYLARAFGSWEIRISNGGADPHLIIWDGRDRWIVLQSGRAGDSWVDEWIIREPQDDTIQQIIQRLKS